MKKLVRNYSLALCAILFAGTMADAASVLYDQPYNGSLELIASQNDPGGFGLFATVFDNFNLGTDSEITDVAWTGGYFNGTASAITSFSIEIYADNAGQPGTLLSSNTIVGNANETLLSGDFFTYSASLNTPFAATNNTTYWLAFVPTIGFPPQWGWAESNVGDFSAYQDFFSARSHLEKNFAFTLQGNAVPEPSTFSLMGIGVSGLAVVRFRRRSRSA